MDFSDAELDELFEKSKNDRAIIVGSDVRQLIGMIRRLQDKIETIESAADDRRMF